MRTPLLKSRGNGSTHIFNRSGIQPSGCSLPRRLACGVITTAAGTACALTAGTACRPALEAVKEVGCCDCLNSRALRRMCNDL